MKKSRIVCRICVLSMVLSIMTSYTNIVASDGVEQSDGQGTQQDTQVTPTPTVEPQKETQEEKIVIKTKVKKVKFEEHQIILRQGKKKN